MYYYIWLMAYASNTGLWLLGWLGWLNWIQEDAKRAADEMIVYYGIAGLIIICIVGIWIVLKALGVLA